MFLISTFSTIISLQDVINAFINYHRPGGALEFYHTVNTGWKHWTPAVEDSTQVVIGDALLKLAHNSSASYLMDGTDSTYHKVILPPGKSLNDSSMIPFLSTTLLLTFATSTITSSLIVHRLLTIKISTDSQGYIQPHFLSRVATLFFESGLIYTLSVIGSLVVYLTGRNIEYVASLAMIHIIENKSYLKAEEEV
ncbi:hypothetical protein B0H10DRAFT_1937636 [Mycena sp. CBHHK59/15]|nr:hypothetical protein B0H10DRAFT_1937636 [Mycena sp. CBHHK59/15]